MTLLITFLAAVIATIVWYVKAPDNTYRIGTLALMYWAAALMWCVSGPSSLKFVQERVANPLLTGPNGPTIRPHPLSGLLRIGSARAFCPKQPTES